MLDFKNCYLGIELGSTRIKSCLIDSFGKPIESGIYEWDNKCENGFWTYDLNQAIYGIGQCYLDLKKKVRLATGQFISTLGGIGISAMMHGLIALDENNRLLTPFRTWRNNYTEDSAKELSEAFGFNIPARWSISHLYYSIENHEEFAERIDRITTLSGYINEKLTGVCGLGKGDASGMFPVDEKGQYNSEYIKIINKMIAKKGLHINVEEMLPKILNCDEYIGKLTPEGALILDPDGNLLPGIPFVAPEGDVATGFMATNSIKPRDGNISAGTSIFGSFVLDKPLKKAYPEIDVVVTPDGKSVAMVHCNNCSSGINECVGLVNDTLRTFGVWKDEKDIFETLFKSALDYQGDFKHIAFYNYLSGENITKVNKGAMLLAHSSGNSINLGEVVLGELFSSFSTFNVGMRILKNEGIKLDNIFVHGGVFKTKGVAQKVFSSVIEEPLSLNKEASEGGSWGMALLCLYPKYHEKYAINEFLEKVVFKNQEFIKENPDPHLVKQYHQFEILFIKCLKGQRILGEELA